MAVEKANVAASRSPLRGKIRFVVEEAEHLTFGDDSFDMAFGNSVLHHLDLPTATMELVRVLRPGGTAIFLEPMGHNRAINWYRNKTPDLRTPDEHPLMMSDLHALSSRFEHSSFEFFHLASLASILLRKRRGFQTSLHALRQVDRVLLSAKSPLRRLAWICVISLSGPIKGYC